MRRHGFTLVEMLVSLALVLFIMVILSQALSTGLETFRQLKATGELDEKLRMASTILRQDLQLDHFEGKRRLSDPSFWNQGPPREGFFHIEQGSPSTVEGLDGDGIPSLYATDHRLHFSIKLRGSQRADFLSANVPYGSPLLSANTTFFGFPPDARFQDPPIAGNYWASYNSQWAEVAYFLIPNGATAGNNRLFALYRRQRLAVANNLNLNWNNPAVRINNANDLNLLPWQYASISCQKNKRDNSFPDFLYFNDPTDLTVPERRLGFQSSQPVQGNPIPLPSYVYTPLQDPASLPAASLKQQGSDLLLTDVVSFTIQVLSPDIDPTLSSFRDLPRLGQPPGIGMFDSWSNVQDDTANYYGSAASLPAPMLIRISALEIILRVYDARTGQTRQITIIQDM